MSLKEREAELARREANLAAKQRTAATPKPATSPAVKAPAPAVKAPAPAAVAKTYVVPAGTQMSVEIVSPVTTKTARVGDRVDGRLATDLIVDGKTLVMAGSPVHGAVTEVVEVTGAAPLLQTENASMGDVITTQKVLSLPLLVITSALAGDEFHWGEAIANSVVLTAFSWLVFIYGLNLTIPLWPSFVG